MSEPALGELDALGLAQAAIQDAWWGCGRLCPGDSVSVYLRLLSAVSGMRGKTWSEEVLFEEHNQNTGLAPASRWSVPWR